MQPRQRASGPIGLAVAVLFALSGCQGSGAVAQVNEKLAAIADSQGQILKRLDELEGKIGTAAPAAPGMPQKPGAPQPGGQEAGRPDPNAVYKVALAGDESSKGPADAKITIVEWSDFQ